MSAAPIIHQPVIRRFFERLLHCSATFILIIAAALLSILSEKQAVSADSGRVPNIVIILADDLGYGDVRCYNPEGQIPTPHMDRLAAEGVRFTDAHTPSAVCTPTRYGLLTGRYCWRSKLKSGVLGGLSPRLIEPDRLTIASLLNSQGYHTTAVGKWHLGMNWKTLPGKDVAELNIEAANQVHNVDYTQPVTDGPNSVGFDEYFGISASLDMVPYAYLRNDRLTAPPAEDRAFLMMAGRDKGGKTRLGPAAADFDAANVLPDLANEAIRSIGARAEAARNGQPFFLYLPFASPHTPILPTADWLGRSGLNPYGDFVMQTDWAVGEVLRKLDEEGLTGNTLVIMTSDNGCSPQAQYPELLAKGHNPSGMLRGHKADLYEGGHRVPFLVRWPGHVPAGKTSEQLVCLTDVLATVADVLDTPLPANAAEDSFSFLPVLTGATEALRPDLISHSINGSFAIREGKWKLLLCPGSGGWSEPRPGKDDTSALPPVQLFDLDADIGERMNLAEAQPDLVERLTKRLEAQVAAGRSTPGPQQPNTTPVDPWKAGRDAHRPLARKTR